MRVSDMFGIFGWGSSRNTASCPVSNPSRLAIDAKGGPANRANFKNVVFVIDDLKSPLSAIVSAGLVKAGECGYRNVTLPIGT